MMLLTGHVTATMTLKEVMQTFKTRPDQGCRRPGAGRGTPASTPPLYERYNNNVYAVRCTV